MGDRRSHCPFAIQLTRRSLTKIELLYGRNCNPSILKMHLEVVNLEKKRTLTFFRKYEKYLVVLNCNLIKPYHTIIVSIAIVRIIFFLYRCLYRKDYIINFFNIF